MDMFKLMQKAIDSEKTRPVKDRPVDERCPQCDSDCLVQKELDTVCSNCGANLGADIDHGLNGEMTKTLVKTLADAISLGMR